MKKILIILCLGGIIFPLTVFGQISPIEKVINSFEKAIVNKDTSLLSGVVADNFSVSTMTWPSSASLFLRVLNRSQKIGSFQLLSDQVIPVDEKKSKVKARVQIEGAEAVETDVFINKDNQILYVDYFDQVFRRDRYRDSELVTRVPIILKETGSILLTLRLNDHPQELHFLFDSGADGMAISRALADSLGIKADRDQQTSVVGGNMNISISAGNVVYLDTFKLLNQNIALFEKMRNGIDGLIGLNIAKDYIAEFDLDQLQLSLYTFGKYEYKGDGEIIEITVPKNIPLVPASLDLSGTGYVDGRFAFDTGANYYLIGFSSFVRSNRLLVSGFKPESQTNTVSFGKSTPTFNGKSVDFKVKDIHLKNMPVALQAGSSWDAGADGSLGIRFISRYNFTINLLEKEIHLVPNKRSALPTD